MTDPALIHYSAQPVRLTRPQPEQDGTAMGKPRGLWLSVEDGNGWREWCESERFELQNLACENIVTLKPDAHILCLCSVADIDDFTGQYIVPLSPPHSIHCIDWPMVAEDYQGISIAPYQWERRLHFDTSWYYGWDCSSGCVWNPAAIKSIEPRKADKPS